MLRLPPISTLFPYTTLFRSICFRVLNIYNNYFKAPWMPDRTEANPNELNQDDARYGFRCCHLKNIDRKSGSAGMPRPISYAVFCLKKKNEGTLDESFDFTAQ